uniref:SIL1 nucleotide exchange factor n=1 Tax=Seriola dumerili TaxID=41447 RepID=A0A3B4T6V9_SERDU
VYFNSAFYYVCNYRFSLVTLAVNSYTMIFVIVFLQSVSALTVVENTEGRGGDEEEEKEKEVNLKVVQPTEQWQSLKPGQAVPAGSHVRLNLQTGQREVRLGEEQLKYWTQEHQRYDTKPLFDQK